MSDLNTFAHLQEVLENLREKDNLRSLRTLEKREGAYAWVAGKKHLNCSSNDYLGLAVNHSLHESFFSTLSSENLIQNYSLGSSSSRLLTGTQKSHCELEHTIAKQYARESALLFTSGYHANIGILPAVLGTQDVVFSDRLNHASLLDGIRLSGAKLYRYNHLDYSQLEHLLEKYRSQGKQAVIITESVFSMDGDVADLPRLVELKKKHAAWLYVDEAHAVGVCGNAGLGICESSHTIADIDFIVGTFGKAFASLGAFLVTDQVVKDYLINTMRSFIFTTALPPIQVGWLNFVWQHMPGFQAKRDHLKTLASQFRMALQAAGLQTRGESQIIPILLGENTTTVAAAKQLQERGYLLYAIRPPTVPKGTSRLRVSLTADMTWQELEPIIATLKSMG
jgi:8-amino-7-oxononanoate synthase